MEERIMENVIIEDTMVDVVNDMAAEDVTGKAGKFLSGKVKAGVAVGAVLTGVIATVAYRHRAKIQEWNLNRTIDKIKKHGYSVATIDGDICVGDVVDSNESGDSTDKE